MIATLTLIVAAGGTCQSSITAAVTHNAAIERARDIADLIELQHRKHELWQTSWVLALGTASAGQVALGHLVERPGRRAALLVSSVKAGIGATAVITIPNRATPWIHNDDPCQQLALAETALVELASAQEAGTALWRHLASLAINMTGILVVGLGYDDWMPALVSGGVGALVGQLLLHTEPTGAIDALAELRAENALAQPSTMRLRPWVSTHGVGLAFTF